MAVLKGVGRRRFGRTQSSVHSGITHIFAEALKTTISRRFAAVRVTAGSITAVAIRIRVTVTGAVFRGRCAAVIRDLLFLGRNSLVDTLSASAHLNPHTANHGVLQIIHITIMLEQLVCTCQVLITLVDHLNKGKGLIR